MLVFGKFLVAEIILQNPRVVFGVLDAGTVLLLLRPLPSVKDTSKFKQPVDFHKAFGL